MVKTDAIDIRRRSFGSKPGRAKRFTTYRKYGETASIPTRRTIPHLNRSHRSGEYTVLPSMKDPKLSIHCSMISLEKMAKIVVMIIHIPNTIRISLARMLRCSSGGFRSSNDVRNMELHHITSSGVGSVFIANHVLYTPYAAHALQKNATDHKGASPPSAFSVTPR